MSKGPLSGIRVLEFIGIGPGPQAAMMLSDLGAEVVRIDRKGGNGWPNPVVDRGRAPIIVDIRSDEGRELCLKAAEKADIVIEGMRPGVMERLGLGPDEMMARNERIIYGRVTGWGQEGPWAKKAGHDINYIGLTGALAAMGKPGETPAPPLNLVGDFGGGSMLLVIGILAALTERQTSGKGQVIDAAIIDGVAHMMGFFTGLIPGGRVSLERDENLLAGSSPFYRVYACSCGGELAVGALEPQFFAELVDKLGASPDFVKAQYDRAIWPQMEASFTEIIVAKSLAEWSEIFEDSDACATPVLPIEAAATHAHNAARATYVMQDGAVQPTPSPRFSRTPCAVQESGDGQAVLDRWISLN